MSVQTTLAALGAVLRAITTPQRLVKVYTDPKEATSLGEFPCVILTMAPQAPQQWTMAASGLARHDYQLTGYLFVGHRQTPIGELHARAIQWPEPIAEALFANLTLNGAVAWLGSMDSDQLFSYQMGPIQWGLSEQDVYFGLKLQIPVTEKTPMAMGG